MAIRLVPKGLRIDTIVRVNEDNKIRFLKGCPYRLKDLIIEAAAHTPRAHDDTRYVRQRINLFDHIKHRWYGNPVDKGKQSKTIYRFEPWEALHLR